MADDVRQEILGGLKRVVIKIGSSVISRKEGEKGKSVYRLDEERVRHFARQVKKIARTGREVVLVSSGAIMAGRDRLGLGGAHLTVPEKQACAAIGQSYLIHAYEKKFKAQGLKVAQMLLSSDDLGNRRRYLNAKHTIEALLEYGVIPIINENDSVTVDEIKIGDNDTLSATVACLVDAGLLVILSDVEGLFSRDPTRRTKNSPPPELIPLVNRVTADIEKLAGKSGSQVTVGGMLTKVLAAKKTMSFGIPTLLVSGRDDSVLEKVAAGETVGTLFWSGRGRIRDRKHWIAHTLKVMGRLMVDAGAVRALVEGGKSLLPAGVLKVEGLFEFGNAVSVVDESSREIARGLVNYNTDDLESIKGLKTSEVRKLVGNNFYEEVVHRDDLVIIENDD